MNNLQTYNQNLPDTIEDLSQFVLVNEERVQALRANIRAIKKVKVAREVYEQKLEEAQQVGEVVVEAAQKMGELLLQIEKRQGNSSRYGEEYKTKTQITSDLCINRNKVSQYQQMAQNPEAVKAAIDKAIERGDVVSRSQVMKEIRAVKEEARRKIEELERREPEVVTREVVPDDYREVKSKAKAYDAETNRLNQKISDMAKERNKLEDQIRELQIQTVQEQSKNSLLSDCVYFVSRCGFFINDVAGYVWLADKLADLPAKEREQYVRAASAVRDWAVALLQSVERDKEYGEPEIQKLIEESAGKPADS